jgi:peptidoglycan hydrolase-like protein with peptidoglycan-binding domain
MARDAPITMNSAGRGRRLRHHLARIHWLRGLGLEEFESAFFDPVLAAGDIPHSRHHWKRVARRYRRYLASGYYSVENWVGYGYALKESGEVSSAAHAYAMALSLEADRFADTHLQTGYLHEARGDTQKAMQCYKSALKLNPDNLDAAEELRALDISDEELSSILDAAKVDRHNIGLHPADRILAARFKSDPHIRRRTKRLALAAVVVVLGLVLSGPSMLVGRPLEITEGAYRSVLAEAARLSGRQNVEVKTAERKVDEDGHLKAEEAARTAILQAKSSVEGREPAERAETGLVMPGQDRKTVQDGLNSPSHEIPTAIGSFGPRTMAILAETQRLSGWQNIEVKAAARKVDEDGHLKAEEAARTAKVQASVEGRGQFERAEAALILSEQDRKTVQVALNSLGHEIPTATGYFGPRTRAMITAWQKNQGLSETGYLDASQFAALQEQATRAKRTEETKLDARQQAQRAEAGLSLSEQDRKRVQVALNSLGHKIPTATGYFGPRTRAMITAWQRAQGLPETGYLTQVQLATLQQQAAPALAQYNAAQMKFKEDGLGTR